ncbi:hypothetical protein K438DRAFT_292819 [Mycena galopus ATCC 62051]|nr:hypothetical protein K438DRAFT_292819 [Mycena galopus ATCC 62051]
MTLASTSNSARGQPAKRKKKPPACDACKARRVLCHRQPEGIPCPRCAEKGIICKTTPTQRGRPRRASEEIVPPSVSNELQPSSSGSNESPDQPVVTVRPRIELSDTSELPPELVKHLFDCLRHLPEYHHPLFHGDQLTIALTSVSWQIELLPPQLRVLASCACALSASISFHSTIIGPSNIESLTDRSTFFPGADLRMYGVRRAPVYRAFYERAFTLACETRIHIDVSDDNAASCFLLDVLERLNPATSQGASRPWAASYISHARILDGCREEEKLRQGPWGGFIMADALVAVARRTPPLFTYDDQLLLCGSEPPPLEQMLQSLKGMYSATKKKRSPVFPRRDLICFMLLYWLESYITKLQEIMLGVNPFQKRLLSNSSRRCQIFNQSLLSFSTNPSYLPMATCSTSARVPHFAARATPSVHVCLSCPSVSPLLSLLCTRNLSIGPL